MEKKQRKYCEGYHFVSTLDKLPKTAHYAVLEFTTSTHMDQWSDMNGGQPFSVTDNVVKYIGFDDEDALRDYIETRNDRYSSYKVIYVKPVDIVTNRSFVINHG